MFGGCVLGPTPSPPGEGGQSLEILGVGTSQVYPVQEVDFSKSTWWDFLPCGGGFPLSLHIWGFQCTFVG